MQRITLASLQQERSLKLGFGISLVRIDRPSDMPEDFDQFIGRGAFLPSPWVSVADEGFMLECIQAFDPRGRLRDIRQLAELQDPHSETRIGNLGRMYYQHTRYLHTLEVGILATIIARNTGLGETDAKHLVAAACSHDAATPAFGDAMKAVAPDKLDEERNYERFFTSEEVLAFCAKENLSLERLYRIVNGEDWLSVALDIADKLAYVGRDTTAYCEIAQHSAGTTSSVWEAFQRTPDVFFTLWETVQRDGERFYFDNPERLGNFLDIRMRMFCEFYLAPRARFREQLVVRLLGAYVLAKRLVTIEQLVSEWSDWKLEALFNQVTGKPFSVWVFGDTIATCEHPASPAEAHKRKQELEKGGAVCLIEHFAKAPKTGADLLTVHDRQIMPYSQACPARTEQLEGYWDPRTAVVLYAIQDPLPWLRDIAEELRELETKGGP